MIKSRFWLALAAGLLWALAFPRFGVAGLAWIAPALMLLAAGGQTGKRAFRIGYLAGLVFNLTTLSWLLLIPYRWHGIPFGPGLGWLALSGFLALYPAAWCWLCRDIPGKEGDGRSSSWATRSLWALKCALLWVAWEMVQARLLSGFPWNLLGSSQYRLTPPIQVASLAGVYGVSFLVVWFSASLANCFTLLLRKPAQKIFAGEIILPTVAVLCVWVWGGGRLSQAFVPTGTLRLALIQPSIPQEVIWDNSQGDQRFARLMDLSQQALAEKPDVLVWPEASMPGLTRENVSAMTNLIASHRASFVFGADDVEFTSTATNFYNSAFQFSPDGQHAGTYRKRLLVMFGEYVPLERWFPFLKFLTPIPGGFARGEKPVHFEIRAQAAQSRSAKTSVLICFEDVFPHYAREHVEPETDFLLNLTNDGWFGNSAAQWQHAINALFRAVENGVPLVRCTNNGLTCWADEFGRLRDYWGKQTGDVYAAGYLIVEVPVGMKHPATFYTQKGDWFGWGCLILFLALSSTVHFSLRFKRLKA